MSETWEQQKARLERIWAGFSFEGESDRQAIRASLTRHEADEKRIGELKAALLHVDSVSDLHLERSQKAEARVAELEAERDRLKAQLNAADPTGDFGGEDVMLDSPNFTPQALRELKARGFKRINMPEIMEQRERADKAERLVAELREALAALRADRAYQKLSGGLYFTSAPTEQEWKAESAAKAWALADAALARAKETEGEK